MYCKLATFIAKMAAHNMSAEDVMCNDPFYTALADWDIRVRLRERQRLREAKAEREAEAEREAKQKVDSFSKELSPMPSPRELVCASLCMNPSRLTWIETCWIPPLE